MLLQFALENPNIGMVLGRVQPDSAWPKPGLGLRLGLKLPRLGRVWADKANPY